MNFALKWTHYENSIYILRYTHSHTKLDHNNKFILDLSQEHFGRQLTHKERI